MEHMPAKWCCSPAEVALSLRCAFFNHREQLISHFCVFGLIWDDRWEGDLQPHRIIRILLGTQNQTPTTNKMQQLGPVLDARLKKAAFPPRSRTVQGSWYTFPHHWWVRWPWDISNFDEDYVELYRLVQWQKLILALWVLHAHWNLNLHLYENRG